MELWYEHFKNLLNVWHIYDEGVIIAAITSI